jgi:hypothetical protein
MQKQENHQLVEGKLQYKILLIGNTAQRSICGLR